MHGRMRERSKNSKHHIYYWQLVVELLWKSPLCWVTTVPQINRSLGKLKRCLWVAPWRDLFKSFRTIFSWNNSHRNYTCLRYRWLFRFFVKIILSMQYIAIWAIFTVYKKTLNTIYSSKSHNSIRRSNSKNSHTEFLGAEKPLTPCAI